MVYILVYDGWYGKHCVGREALAGYKHFKYGIRRQSSLSSVTVYKNCQEDEWECKWSYVIIKFLQDLVFIPHAPSLQ